MAELYRAYLLVTDVQRALEETPLGMGGSMTKRRLATYGQAVVEG